MFKHRLLHVPWLTICFAWSCVAEDRPFDPAKPAASMRPVVRVMVPPPAPHHRVRDYGAKGDGTTFDTAAIQKAIDATTGTGGSVILDAGQYVTAPLVLKGKMTFYLTEGATLLGSLSPEDYPALMPERCLAWANQRSLLYACAAHGLIIDGPGIIDGRGKELKMDGPEPTRPSLLRIFQSTDVTVRNIVLRNPRMWTAVYDECVRLTIQATTTEAPPYCPNLDGMDICDSRQVVIRDNTVNSEDDAICLKSHGATGLEDILITNNQISCHRANGIKIGTASVGPIRKLRILDNTISHAMYAGLCVESVDGAFLTDVLVRGLEMNQVGQPFYIRLAARMSGNKNGDRKPGTLDGVVIERFRALKSHRKTKTSTSTITGLPGQRVSMVVFRDGVIEVPGGLDKVPKEPAEMAKDYPQSNMFGPTPGSVFYIRHGDGVRLERVQVRIAKPDVRPWLATSDAEVAVVDSGPAE